LLVELLDAGDPDAPVVVVETTFEGEVPEAYQGTFTAFEEELFFCHRASAATEPVLVRLAPSLTSLTPTTNNGACASLYQASAATAGLFASWTVEENSNGGSFTITGLANVEALASFGFSGTGIHQYGSIVGAGTDGSRVVFSVENDDWMLAYGDVEGEGFGGGYLGFSAAGPKRLLTVFNERAYFLTPEAVVAYDLTNMTTPKLLEQRANSNLDPGTTVFLAATTDALLVRDAEGAVWSVPPSLTAPVVPTPTYLGDPPDGSLPCEN
jgi:hypothetical protein